MIFRLLPKDRTVFITPDDRWLKSQAFGKSTCPDCSFLLPGYYPKPIEPWLVVLPGKQTVNSLWRCAAVAMRNDLVDLLQQHMSEWVWGRCFDSRGELIATHQICYEPKHLWIRGDENSKYRGRCPICGTPRLTRAGFPRVLRRDLAPGKHVYLGKLDEILVTEALAQSIDWNRFKDIELFKVVEVDEPMDGLPANVDDWPAEGPGTLLGSV